MSHFLGLKRVARIIDSHTGVEESTEHEFVGLEGERYRLVFVDIMRAEAAGTVAEVFFVGQR